jgi:hypothetical protein
MSIDIADAPASAPADIPASRTAPAASTTGAASFFTYLIRDCGYGAPKVIRPGVYACIMPLMFTHAIITGRIGDRMGYDDRWCFSSLAKAQAALDAWDGAGEPQGWHRHPRTGRRRIEGGPATEYVDP